MADRRYVFRPGDSLGIEGGEKFRDCGLVFLFSFLISESPPVIVLGLGLNRGRRRVQLELAR